MKRPEDRAVAVCHFHQAQLTPRSPIGPNFTIAPARAVFSLVESKGNIWITDMPR